MTVVLLAVFLLLLQSRYGASTPKGCEVVREVVDKGNKIRTQWCMYEIRGLKAAESKAEVKAAYELISKLPDPGCSIQSGTLVENEALRIDLQGRFNEGSHRYINLQIQQNRLRKGSSDSTSIAAAIIQADCKNGELEIPLKYIKDCLFRSLGDKENRACRLETFSIPQKKGKGNGLQALLRALLRYTE